MRKNRNKKGRSFIRPCFIACETIPEVLDLILSNRFKLTIRIESALNKYEEEVYFLLPGN